MSRRKSTAINQLGFNSLHSKKSGRFTEVTLIRSDKDLDRFKKQYGVDTIKTEY